MAPTPAQLELHHRTGELLRAAFGPERVREVESDASHHVSLGRLGVRAGTEPIGEAAAVLELSAWIAQGLVMTDEIGGYLAQRTGRLRFSALSVNDEGAIILRHSLFAESVAEPVVSRLVGVMAKSADALDEELRTRFGG